MMDAFKPYLDSAFLGVVIFACVIHINRREALAWCMRWGFALIIGGSAGIAISWWWPVPAFQTNYWADLILHAGMACVALGLSREEIKKAVSRSLCKVSAAVEVPEESSREDQR